MVREVRLPDALELFRVMSTSRRRSMSRPPRTRSTSRRCSPRREGAPEDQTEQLNRSTPRAHIGQVYSAKGCSRNRYVGRDCGVGGLTGGSHNRRETFEDPLHSSHERLAGGAEVPTGRVGGSAWHSTSRGCAT